MEVDEQKFTLYFYRTDKDKAQMPMRLETLKFLNRRTFEDVSSGSLIPNSYYALIDKYG